MARAKYTKTTKRVRKTGGSSGYVKCNICHGTGLSFFQISEKYGLSLTAVKKIIYGVGDKILLKLEKAAWVKQMLAM